MANKRVNDLRKALTHVRSVEPNRSKLAAQHLSHRKTLGAKKYSVLLRKKHAELRKSLPRSKKAANLRATSAFASNYMNHYNFRSYGMGSH